MVEKREAVLGTDHPDTLEAKTNYAITLTNLKKFKKAEEVQEEVMVKKEELLSPRHLEAMTAKIDYAVTLRNLQKYREAERRYSEVIEIANQSQRSKDIANQAKRGLSALRTHK